MSEEERMELEFDKKHLSMELVAAGDDINRPLTGDVVRVRYTAYVLTMAGLYNAEALKVPLLSSPPSSRRLLADGHEHQVWSAEAMGGVRAGRRDDHQGCRPSSLQDVHWREDEDTHDTHLRLWSPPLSFLTDLHTTGALGLPPHIPPDSRMLFDLTLLGFRRRAVWIKPMIQVLLPPS
jgi:hypothetical protein